MEYITFILEEYNNILSKVNNYLKDGDKNYEL
jgi:hypothetical protein